MTINFLGYALGPSFALLAGAAALVLGGSALISRGLRIHREQVAERTTLIAPWTPARASAPGSVVGTGAGLLRTSSEFDQETARRLGRVGIPASRAPAALRASRFVSAAVLALLALVLGGYIPLVSAHLVLRIFLVLAGLTGGWFLPLMLMQWSSARRIKAIVAGFPDALELLVICAEAGLALEEGIDRVVVELRGPQPELADELALMAADLKILPSRDEALSKFADRIDQQNVRSVVTTLSQTMRFGTPLSQALRSAASEMRNESLVRLEERTNRLPALLTIPMMLFIMPTIFLIIGGPAVLRLVDVFFR